MTPLTSLKFAELVVKAGFPPGVVNILPGSGIVNTPSHSGMQNTPGKSGLLNTSGHLVPFTCFYVILVPDINNKTYLLT